MAILASAHPEGFISGRAACRMMGGASPYTLQALALRGEIRTDIAPGRPPAYRREDVERIVRARRSRGRGD
jgi:hypothetical protein